jgi:hypothetical protein
MSTVALVGCDPADRIVDRLHGCRRTDHRPEAAELAELGAQVRDLLVELATPGDVGEHGAQARDVEGLRQVVGGALAERLDRGVDARVSRDDDDVRRRGLVHEPHELEAGAVGEGHVEQQQVRHALLEQRLGLRERPGRLDAEAVATDQLGEAVEEFGVVVDDDCVGHVRRRRAA